MSCHHADTTAVLAVFDEAPPGYAAHLRGCAQCQRTVAAHRQTVALITPVLSARRRLPWGIALVGLALAAAVLLLVMPQPTTDVPAALLLSDGIDDQILALELELALLNLEE